MAQIIFGLLFLAPVLAGGIAGGMDLARDKCELSINLCNTREDLKTFNAGAAAIGTILDEQNTLAMSERDALIENIATQHRAMNLNYKAFIAKYIFYLIGGILFLMAVVFMLVLRKFVFKQGFF